MGEPYRHLAVEYFVDLGTQEGIIAYALGTVDLSTDALDLSKGVPTVQVTLNTDKLYCNQADLDAFAPPQGDCRQRTREVPESWFWCYQQTELLVPPSGNQHSRTDLDCNDDGTPNLDEVCSMGLSCP